MSLVLWTSWFEGEQVPYPYFRGMHHKMFLCHVWAICQKRCVHGFRNFCRNFIATPPHQQFLVLICLGRCFLLLTPLFVSTTQYTYVYWHTIHCANTHIHISHEHEHSHTRAHSRSHARAHVHCTHTRTHGGFMYWTIISIFNTRMCTWIKILSRNKTWFMSPL